MKATILAVLITAGCAAAPPADRDAAEYERIESRLKAMERYEALRQACRASGGVLFVDQAWGGRLSSTPDDLDLRTARCAAPVSRMR